jgi:hypothetical protein
MIRLKPQNRQEWTNLLVNVMELGILLFFLYYWYPLNYIKWHLVISTECCYCGTFGVPINLSYYMENFNESQNVLYVYGFPTFRNITVKGGLNLSDALTSLYDKAIYEHPGQRLEESEIP